MESKVFSASPVNPLYSGMILYQETPPPQGLRHCIASYWRFEYRPQDKNAGPLQHIILPDGCLSILFIAQKGRPLSPPLAVFPTAATRQVKVEPRATYLGIRIFPGCARPILGVDLNQPGYTVSPVSESLHGLDTSLIFSRLNAGLKDYEFLTPVLTAFLEKKQPKMHPRVQRAVHAILEVEGNIRIANVAKRAHMSMRQLQRCFKEEVGLTPKEFARVRRLRNALIKLMLEDRSFQDVLFEQGYFDPAHFNKDFFSIVGTKPKLFEAYISQIEHLGLS